MLETINKDTLAVVPLRAGSKGLPGKNLHPFAGKPLYRHALEQAQRVIGQCVISTDIPEIIQAELPACCRVVERPAVLAEDHTPMTPVLMHLFRILSQEGRLPKRVVLMQATSPLRRDQDIRAALSLFDNRKFELVMSVVKADSGILKFGFTENNRFIPIAEPAFCFANRQSLPEIMRPNGAVYVFSPHTFLKNGGLATQSIGSIEMPSDFSIDIDTHEDLKAAY